MAQVRKRSLLPEVSPETALLLFRIAYVGLILGAMFVLGGTLLLFWSDGELKRHDNLRLSANELETSRAKRFAAQAGEGAAKANAIAANANERAAALEKEAAQARLELERLQQQLRGRRLSEAQLQIISDGLRGIQFQVKLAAIASDPEAMQFGGDIERALEAAGLKARLVPTQIFSRRPITGLRVSGPRSDVERVAQPFMNAGLDVAGRIRDGDVEILVGSKPLQK